MDYLFIVSICERQKKKKLKHLAFIFSFSTFAFDMKILTYFGLVVFLSVACSSNGIKEQLNEIDSLVTHEHYDSADVILSKIDTFLLTDDETKAHYYLLRTQLNCVLRSCDDFYMLNKLVIPHYISTGSREKLADAYYYKAFSEREVHNTAKAVSYYKLAEELASNTSNLPLQYKIAEALAYINAKKGNQLLRLQYAEKCAKIAQSANNKGWLAYSFLNKAMSHKKLNHKDSFETYINQAAQLIKYVADKDKYAFISNLAFLYKHSQPEIALHYYNEALQLKENSIILEHIADIYNNKGDYEEAYRIWKKALYITDDHPKDNILHNLLDYDVEHGKTDSVCKRINEIMAIKDSLINSLKNDTIKDLQLRFDHEVAMRKQEAITSNWQKGLLAAILFISLLIAYIIIKRYREKARMQEAQIQINDLMDQIHELEKSEEDNTAAIQKLNDQIKSTMDKEGVLLKQGKMLYDQIANGGTTSEWHKKEFELFIHYYKAIHFKTVKRLERTKRKEKLTPQKLFFLLLNDMGYEKKDIARILGIEETSVNTLFHRTRPIE